MKFYLYFHFYVMSLGGESQYFNTSTIIWMRNDSITFYVHTVGYVKWKVDHVEKEIIREIKSNVYIVNAIYFVSLMDLKAIVYIEMPDAEIRILTGRVPITIKLYNKP